MIKLLIISRAAWRSDNNIGNTLSNIFDKDFVRRNFEIHNLYMRGELPCNEVVTTTYRISEGALLKSCFTRRPCGGEIKTSDDEVVLLEKSSAQRREDKAYAFAKKNRSFFFAFVRELLWTFGVWKNDRLKEYLQRIQPDVVFFPVFGCWYPSKVLHFIHKICNAKIALFFADDNYTLRQYSLSPMYWFNRFVLRKWIRRDVRIASLFYAISDVQKNDCEKSFHKSFKILTKIGDFEGRVPSKETYSKPYKLVYTGNLAVGRWKSLAAIGRAIQRIDPSGATAQLDVYSTTPMTKKMLCTLDVRNCVNFMGGIPASEVSKVQKDADMLVHVESFDLKYRLATRQSFSTKIVDYLRQGRCILAVGKRECASIDFFVKNDVGITAESEEDIERQLRVLFDDPSLMTQYARRGWLFGKENHSKERVQNMILEDFQKSI